MVENPHTYRDDLAGKIAEEQRRSLATYYVNHAIDEATAFLRTPRKSREAKREWALNVLGIASANLERIGMAHRYVKPDREAGQRVGQSKVMELSRLRT